MGVQEMTRFGMKESDFTPLAQYLAEVIRREKDVAPKVAEYRRNFTRMHYCLPEEEARPLVEELIGTLLK
jgi:glycine/serine hydroxymethyltransferase